MVSPKAALNLDFTDLKLFAAIADAGSITGGAERVHLTLASASERVRGMELATGLPLLTRGRRGVALTPSGETLLQHARTILDQMQRLAGDLGEHNTGLRGSVRLLVNTAAWMEYLLPKLSSFLAGHPGIDVDVEERPSPVIVDAVAGGRTELGIVAATTGLAGLERRAFAQDRLVAVMPKSLHPERHTMSFSDLLDHPMIELPLGNALQLHIVRQASRMGGRLSVRTRAATFDAMAALIATGSGVGIMPEVAARRNMQRSTIRYIPLSDDWASRQLLLCARDFSRLTPHALMLADHLSADYPDEWIGMLAGDYHS